MATEVTASRTSRDLRAVIADWGIVGRTPETTRLVAELRAGEDRLRRRFDALSQEASDALLWQMAAEGVPEALAWEGSAPLPQLCERALALRGGLEGGRARVVMRERARVLLHLASSTRELPRRADDLLDWWDEATRLEPFVRMAVATPRWRTSQDGLPFTGVRTAWFREPSPLVPGSETADPASIPTLAARLA